MTAIGGEPDAVWESPIRQSLTRTGSRPPNRLRQTAPIQSSPRRIAKGTGWGMAQERTQRRLAAIMATDVVGYSRLIEQDEAGTLAALKQRRREILTPLVAQHQGRIVKVMGDGVLVEFASAVNAVACAVELQEKVSAANDGLADDQRIILRIGINLGDVVVEGGDLYGDGVIIAVRLQAMAEPGGICISGSVYEQVGNKMPFAFEDLGPCEVKNIAAPVRTFRVRADHSGEAVRLSEGQPTESKTSVVVRPFTNMSGDPEQQYFSDGITEDIITELSRFHHLHVLARNISSRHRKQDVDAIHVGRELAQYLVEGSVRRIGDRIRITAQLVETRSGHHLWAERFDRKQEDIFAVQDQVVRTIVATLVGRLRAARAAEAKHKPPTSLAAYDCVLRGYALPVYHSDAEAEARRLFEKAIDLDPDYARAYSLLAYSFFREWHGDMSSSDSALDRAFEMAKKAVTLGENDSNSLATLGWVYLFRQVYDLAEHYHQKALELNPNTPNLMTRLGALYGYTGRIAASLDCHRQAKLLDPFFDAPWYWQFVGATNFVARQYDESIVAFGRSSTMPFWAQAYLAACCALSNRIDRSRHCAAEVVRLSPDFSLTRYATKEPYKNPADREHLMEGLRKAGLPE
jgi:adenylate cyclase